MLTLREHRDLEKLLGVGIAAYRLPFDAGNPSAETHALFRAVQKGWLFLQRHSKYVHLEQCNKSHILAVYLLKPELKRHRRHIVVVRKEVK